MVGGGNIRALWHWDQSTHSSGSELQFMIDTIGGCCVETIHHWLKSTFYGLPFAAQRELTVE